MNKPLLTAGALIVALAFNPAAFAQPYEMQLDSVSPTSGPGGATVRLIGRGFGASQAGHRVVMERGPFVRHDMTVRSWSDTQIVAVVPPGAEPGRNTIAILNPVGETGRVNASRSVPFTVMAGIKPGSIPGVKKPGQQFKVPKPVPKQKLPTTPRLRPGVDVGDATKRPVPGLTPGRPPQIKPIGCPIDPAVTELRVIHPRKIPDGTYVFWLHASIRNIGTEAFQSGPGQASYTLRQGTRVLYTRNFTNLGPGARLEAGASIESWLASTEFPPDFTLQINYDPDIRIDGNPRNDDCRMTNNKKTLSGTEVNRVLTTAIP